MEGELLNTNITLCRYFKDISIQTFPILFFLVLLSSDKWQILPQSANPLK